MNIEEKENLSLEALKERLMRNYQENKYKIDEKYEKKLHNNISIVLNYRFEDEYQYWHEVKLYTELVLFLVKDFVLYTMYKVNEYVSKKYKIDNFELKNRNDNRLFKGFLDEIDNLKRNQDEKLIKWTSLELISQSKLIESNLIIKCLDDFLRVERIISNAKEKMNNLDSDYIVNLIQIFYDFKDKFRKNKFIGEHNDLQKLIVDELSRKNKNGWVRRSEDEMEKTSNYNHEEKNITYTRTIKVKPKGIYSEQPPR